MELMNVSLEHAYQIRSGMVSASVPKFDKLDIRASASSAAERIVVSHEGLEVVARDLTVIGRGLEEMSRLAAVRRAVNAPGITRPEVFERVTGKVGRELSSFQTATEIADIVKSIRNDMDQFHDKPVVLLRSETFEKLAETALTGTSIPGVRNLPGSGGLVKEFWRVLDDNNLITHQARVSLTREAVEIGSPTFGVIDLTRAAAAHVGSGHADIDTIETYLNGAVGLTWGLVGYLSSGGNLAVADRTQNYGEALATTGSYLMRESGAHREVRKWFDTDFRNQAQSMSEMYRFHVDRALYDHVKPMSFSEFYSEETLRDSGYSPQLRQADERYYSESLQKAPTGLKTLAIRDGAGSVAEGIQDGRIAAGFASAGHKVVVYGNSPAADAAYRQMTDRLGAENVKQVRVAPSTYERNRIASDFGADTVIRVSQDRYREVTQAGVRQIIREPTDRLPTPRRSDFPPPDTKYPTLLPPPRQPPPPPAGGGPPGGGGGGAGGYGSGPDRFPPPPAIDSSRLFRASGIASRFDSPSSFPRVGGVMLQGAAEAGNSDSQLTAGNFSLIFQGGNGEIDIPMLRRFVTALWATYWHLH